ncbi:MULTISPECIES: hypothetical protein [Cupriavidus]
MLTWFTRHYLPDPRQAADVRASPLRQRALADVATAVHRWPGQIHGFMSMLGVLDAADSALDLAAAALRAAFAGKQTVA